MWELEDFTEIRRWNVLHLLLCLTFFLSSLLINLIQVILFFTLRPFNKSLFRSINYYLIYSMMSQILFLAEWWSCSDVIIYSDDEHATKWGTEHALITMNHSYEVDWVMGWIVADRSNVLGSSKVFVKDMMKYVPTIGWAWSMSDVIFLHRNWQKDKSVMQDQIKEFFDYPHPVWMLLFCEGTRFTPAKHAASMEVARSKGLKELKHVLLPRTRGFIQCAESMKGEFHYIYDVTVAFDVKEGAEPSLLSMLRGHKVVGEVYIRRLPLADVPTDTAGAAEYLHQLYRDKDDLLDSYINTGSFTEQNNFPSYKARSLPRRYWSLLNMLGWTGVVFSIFMKQYYNLVTQGSLLANVSVLLFFFVAYIMLYKMIGLTRIDKGSHYGNKKNE